MRYVDGSVAYQYVNVPAFTRNHCNMAGFRNHPKYGGFANSDIFHGILNRIRNEVFGPNYRLNLNEIPDGVNVDASGFLAIVTLNIQSNS